MVKLIFLIVILSMCFSLCSCQNVPSNVSTAAVTFGSQNSPHNVSTASTSPVQQSNLTYLVNYIENNLKVFLSQSSQLLMPGILQAAQGSTVGQILGVLIKYFMDAYNASGLSKWNQTMLLSHLSNASGLFLSQLSALDTAQDILRLANARMLFPLPKISNINKECYEDAMDVLDGVTKLQVYDWARAMFDATGKLPAGVLKGHVTSLGSYDQCLEIHVKIPRDVVLGNTNKTSFRYPREFDTKYCRASLTLDASVFGDGVDLRGINPIITIGLCIPQSCKANDVETLLQLGYLGKSLHSYKDKIDVVCTEERKLNSSAIAAVVILSIFGILIVLGTLYEIVQKFTQDKTHTTGEINDSYKSQLNQNTGQTIRKENEYAYCNNTFQSEEKTGQRNGVENRYTDIGETKKEPVDLPSGYMHHKEGDSFNPTEMKKNEKYNISQTENNSNGYAQKNGRASQYVEVTIPGKPSQQLPQAQEDVFIRFLKSFSVVSHAPKILSGKSGPGAITCLHGIRFFSISWIILGHTYNYGLVTVPGVITSVNFLDALPMIQRFTYQAVVGGGFAVDTFYMISGMLLSFIQLKEMAKLKKHPTPARIGNYVFYYYFHRFWRLTPIYMMVLMVFTCLSQYMGDGPMWPDEIESAANCRKNWWTNLLYVNNLVKVNEMCMAWSWFLSNDMQFYVIGILLLLSLTINNVLGCVVVFLLMSAGIASAAWKESIYNGNFFTMKSDGGAFWNNVYITPWCRVAAFCVGFFLGFILYKKPKAKLSKLATAVGWCLAIALGLGLVYCPYSENKKDGERWSVGFRSAYESLGRPLWAACVAWVVLACHYGKGGIVNSILSWSGLVPLSRLSYAAYLVHPILMMIHVFSKRALVYLNDYDIIYLYLGHIVMTFMVAFVISLAFEAPFMALEKILMKKK